MKKIKIKDFYITIDRCLIYKDYGIIADTHIGFDVFFGEGGANFPLLQKDEVIKKALNIVEKYKISNLIINGDIKHNFKPFPKEIEFLKEFIDFMSEYVNVILIKGNHDTFISPTGYEIFDYFEIDNYIIFHGDREINKDLLKNKFWILGHEHPSIKLRDEVGAIIKLPAYLLNKNYIVLPAFNPLSPGNDLINNPASSKVIKKDYLNSEVIAITDIGLLNFGTLRKLREFAKSHL
ncbi:metallophosphoesterase [Methanocaldococcus fervens]|uniref:Phosphoesterase n=1 Tax=Methanocaldococcus fervens (strain DSM 4213 / JCM 15782 / AG86) TaxID=573064 RepID=C7P757_METFA|nr:metallophosphoesterase [Methanocaldococcus fervens]ACV24389.1 phosphoesterase [Methanocaldococcus fervens AG86]